jgi:MFS family permease
MSVEEDHTVERVAVVPSRILPCIVYSQFAGTSLWFAGNAVLSDFADELNLPDSSLEILTSAVQAGFIVGTLLLAITNLVDRFLPTHIFLASALAGAATNALIPSVAKGIVGMTILRFLTGATLAGIYPVGMKVAADWYRDGLGRALGLLVGALVLGTAFPFLLRQIPQSWELLLYETSILAASGGLVMVAAVPNGPYRKAASKFDPAVVVTLFQSREFAAAACGYFGHMWELYAFWTWCPVVLDAYLKRSETLWSESVVTFAVISVGALGCILGGLVIPRFGSGRIALVSLIVSGTCCLLSPVFYFISIPEITLIFYLVWGTTVVSDSPQFSTLVADSAPAEQKGTALTVVNCIGFAISIGSIQLLGVPVSEAYLFLLLAPGPVYGIFSMRRFFGSREGKALPERTSTLALSNLSVSEPTGPSS